MFLIQFVLHFPIISLFNQETGWVYGLYYFHHIISSLNQVLDSCYNFPPFLHCLNQVLYLNASSSFTSNNTKKLGGFGRADGSRKRCTCRHVGSWGSRARPLLKDLYLRVIGMSAAAGRNKGRRTSRAGVVSERTARAEDRAPPAAVGFLPRRR